MEGAGRRERTALVVRSDVVVDGGHLAVEGVALLVDIGEYVRVRAVAAVAGRGNREEAGCRDVSTDDSREVWLSSLHAV